MRIRLQGFVLMYCSASSTQQPPILPPQPFLHLSLGAGAAGPCRDVGHTHAAFLVSLLAPPALSRCEFLCCCCLCHAKVSSQQHPFPCKNGCLVCSWLLLTTCMEHACPAVGKTSCYQQMGEDRWEEWWKVTGYGLNDSTSIARPNTISLPAVTIE